MKLLHTAHTVMFCLGTGNMTRESPSLLSQREYIGFGELSTLALRAVCWNVGFILKGSNLSSSIRIVVGQSPR